MRKKTGELLRGQEEEGERSVPIEIVRLFMRSVILQGGEQTTDTGVRFLLVEA